MDVITLISFLLCVILALLSITLWQKATGFHHLLQEAANRFEESRSINNQLKDNGIKIKTELDELRLTLRRLEQQNSDLKSKNNHLSIELKKMAQNPKIDVQSLENENVHLRAQVVALTGQLKETDLDLAQLREKNHVWERQFNEKVNSLIVTKDNEITSLKTSIRKLQQELAQLNGLQGRIAEFEKLIAEHKQIKRKFANQQHIMKSIRGLKEMAEERLENYETALRLLASHTLGKPMNQTREKPIGPLIGAALESIGQEILPETHLPTNAENLTS